MNTLPAVLGILLGLVLTWGQLTHPWRKPFQTLLTALTALVWTLLGLSLLTWLAVLPPDSPRVYTVLLLKGGAVWLVGAGVATVGVRRRRKPQPST